MSSGAADATTERMILEAGSGGDGASDGGGGGGTQVSSGRCRWHRTRRRRGPDDAGQGTDGSLVRNGDIDASVLRAAVDMPPKP